MSSLLDQLSLLELEPSALECIARQGILKGQKISRASNGMPVITEYMPPEYGRPDPVIKLYVWNVGYLNSPFAVPHGVEHMLIERSTDSRTGENYLERAEERGSINNAEVERAHAVYYVKPATTHEMFSLLHDLMEQIANAKFDPLETQQEYGSMRDEVRRWESDSEVASSLIARGILFGMYPHHFRLWENGTIQDINALSWEDLKDAKAFYYTPRNMTLFVAGAFPYANKGNNADTFHRDVLDVVERFFSIPMERNGFRFTQYVPRVSITSSLPPEHFERDISDIFFSKAYGVEGLNESNAVAADVIARILTARVYMALRMTKGFTYYTQFRRLDGPENAFVFRTSFEPLGAKNAIEQLHDIERDVRINGVTEREFEIHTRGLINTARREYRDGTSLIRMHKDARLGRQNFYSRISTLETLTSKDVHNAAQMILSSPSVEVTLGPSY